MLTKTFCLNKLFGLSCLMPPHSVFHEDLKCFEDKGDLQISALIFPLVEVTALLQHLLSHSGF